MGIKEAKITAAVEELTREGEIGADAALLSRLRLAGVELGFSRSRNHPSARPFVFGYKNGAAVINLVRTAAALQRAKRFLRQQGSAGQTVFWLSGKPETAALVAEAAQGLGMPYVVSRWIGGTFTNWSEISTRLEQLRSFRAEKESSSDGKTASPTTKRERALQEKKIARLERYWLTLLAMRKLPAGLVVVDSEREKTAVREAAKVNIPVVSISGTDCDLRGIDYPIVANDSGVASVRMLLGELAAAYEEGRRQPVSSPVSGETPAAVPIPV